MVEDLRFKAYRIFWLQTCFSPHSFSQVWLHYRFLTHLQNIWSNNLAKFITNSFFVELTLTPALYETSINFNSNSSVLPRLNWRRLRDYSYFHSKWFRKSWYQLHDYSKTCSIFYVLCIALYFFYVFGLCIFYRNLYNLFYKVFSFGLTKRFLKCVDFNATVMFVHKKIYQNP